eukprot:jgi/Tetstr1/438568/TSEL_027119.t1
MSYQVPPRTAVVPDLYEPFGKLKEINFEAVLNTSEELQWAGVTDTATKRQTPVPRSRLKPVYTDTEVHTSRSAQGSSRPEHIAGCLILCFRAFPESPDGILPVPEGVNELICLQDAVTSVSHEKFTTHYAKLGWRKWAMMMANANVMVDLFWWISATFFSQGLRTFLYHRFSRHFINLLIVDAEMGDSSLQSKLRDTYQRNFIHMLAVAACNLFRAAAPRSAPLFDAPFLEAVTKQLRIWTSGLLPADSHSMKAAGAGGGTDAAEVASTSGHAQLRTWRKHKATAAAPRGVKDAGNSQAEAATLGVEVPAEGDLALPQLRGKAARGAFDIAKTSPFVTHFLEYHNLKPNDLNRGLLNRHVCGSRLQQPFMDGEEEEKCASFAAPAVRASRAAQSKYAKKARGAVGHKLRVRKSLQSGLAELKESRSKALRGEAAREMANALANWVDFSKEQAAEEEAERRDVPGPDAGDGDEREDTPELALMGGRNKALKDGRDMMAHHHSLTTRPPERTGGYQRHSPSTSSVRIARQAREALGSMYRDYGSMPTQPF